MRFRNLENALENKKNAAPQLAIDETWGYSPRKRYGACATYRWAVPARTGRKQVAQKEMVLQQETAAKAPRTSPQQ
jgi:hypothetical protein